MKQLITLMLFLLIGTACKSQELYITLDTRDRVNIKYKLYHYNNNKYIDNITAKYFILKDDPGEWYGGTVLLEYYPYTDSILNKCKWIRKLRTKNISKNDWEKLKSKKGVKIVDALEWKLHTPWDTIYKDLHKYFLKNAMYVVDKKFETKDSVQIRGVGYINLEAQE